jgi:hypothetical protein
MKQMREQIQRQTRGLMAGACGLVLALGVATAGVAQQAGLPSSAVGVAAKPAAAATKPMGSEEKQTAKPRKGGGEGISVHGHWVITVKNADGTVAEKRDFENSLTTSGAENTGSQLMAALLSGNASPGGPGLALLQSVPADPTAACFGYIPDNCTVFVTAGSPIESSDGFPVVLESGLTSVANFSPNPSLTLGGTYTQSDAMTNTYTAVESIFPVCVAGAASYITKGIFSNTSAFGNANLGPNQCNLAYLTGLGALPEYILGVPFTFTLITQGGVAAPITLAPSQTIAINFTLSFS